MDKAQEILEQMPDVKIGIDSFYGQQTVLNALNKALNIPPVIPCDLQAETFKLANKLALAGRGNEAVKLHRISNSLG